MKPTLHAFTCDQLNLLRSALAKHNNDEEREMLDALLRQPLTFGEAVSQIGDDATNSFVAAAGEHRLLSEGTLDIDGKTIVSESEDGAYVMVWLWIDNEAAGVNPEPTGMDEG